MSERLLGASVQDIPHRLDEHVGARESGRSERAYLAHLYRILPIILTST